MPSVRMHCPYTMLILMSLELKEVINMHNESIPLPLFEQSFCLINTPAQLHTMFPSTSPQCHPQGSAALFFFYSTSCHINSGQGVVLSIL